MLAKIKKRENPYCFLLQIGNKWMVLVWISQPLDVKPIEHVPPRDANKRTNHLEQTTAEESKREIDRLVMSVCSQLMQLLRTQHTVYNIWVYSNDQVMLDSLTLRPLKCP